MNSQTSILYKTLRRLLNMSIAIILSAMTLLASIAHAEDTDVFLGSTGADSATSRPNVLFILDTSGSMGFESDTEPGVTRMGIMKPALINILKDLSNVNVGLMTFNSAGGPVRYPIRYIDAPVAAIENTSSTLFTINRAVQQGSDDAEQDTVTNDVVIDRGRLHLSNFVSPNLISGSTSAYATAGADDGREDVSTDGWNSSEAELSAASTGRLGFLFRDLAIPSGATIVQAFLDLTLSRDASNRSVRMDIDAEDADDAQPFSGTNDVLENRNWTSAVQNWSVAIYDQDQVPPPPNLVNVIQEVVSRPGWAEGNNIALRMQREGGSGSRFFYSYEGAPVQSRQPRLRVDFTTTPNPVVQTLGLRFQNMTIPQGARITRAYLGVKASKNSSAAVSYTIRGEKIADAPTFTATANNIGARIPTGAAATWALTPGNAWASGNTYYSADFTGVIQEIVNQANWCGGQALSLIMEADSGAGREIYSYEGSSGTNTPPTLHVEYDTSNLTTDTGCVISTFVSQVRSGSDDAEEESDGDVKSTEDYLELGNFNGAQHVGLRFQDVKVPAGAGIIEAYLQFTAQDNRSEAVSLTIEGHKSIEPLSFNGKRDISGRVTTAGVSWTPGAWVDEQIYNSADIRSVIQELIDQTGWGAGNSMALIVSTNSGGYRRAHSYNNSASRAPKLFIRAKVNTGSKAVGQTVRQQLIEEVINLETVASTPTVNVYTEALRYFRGMPMYWGRKRYNQDDADQYGRVSHKDSYTNGTLVQPTGCTNLALDNEACIREEVTGSPVYISPITDPCQTNYIVLLSDGEQNSFSSADGTATILGQSCNSADGGFDCGVKLAKFAKDTDHSPLPGDQRIFRTDTIGFSANVPFLEAMAGAGGGKYYQANNSATLSSAFQSIIAEILSKPSTFIAPTLTISAYNRLFNSDEIYLSIFKPELNAAWQGNVKKYFLCKPKETGCVLGQLVDVNRQPAVADGHIKKEAQSDWKDPKPEVGDPPTDGPLVTEGGAGRQAQLLAEEGKRNIYTYTGIKDLSHPDNAVKIGNPKIDAAMFGPDFPNDQDEINKMIDWMHGVDVDDEDVDDNRTEIRWLFGDPLHSAAVTVNYGKPDNSTDPRQVVTKLFVGTNDGGFRMINTSNGHEEWMFIPPEFMKIQERLRDNASGEHAYGMDGSPVDWVFDKDGDSNIEPGTDFVRVFIGQRRGGKKYYAFDLTPDVVLTAPAEVGKVQPELLWQIDETVSGFSRLGQTWSTPFRTTVLVDQSGTTVRKNVLVFGGGYDPLYDQDPPNDSIHAVAKNADGTARPYEGNAIYIVDAEKGTLLWSASDSTSDATVKVADMVHSIPSDIRPIDTNGDSATDRLYVGDMGGQVWRVDLGVLSASAPGGGAVVGKLADLADSTQAASKRHFMYRPQTVLINDKEFANGKYRAVALTTGDRENPLARHVHDRVYVLRDYHLQPMAGSNGLADTAAFRTIKETDLTDVTDDVQPGQVDTAALKAASNYGWLIEFKEKSGLYIGEKGITDGQILISAKPTDPVIYTFNTYAPSNLNEGSACSVSLGTNRTYFINLLNGAGTDIINNATYDRSKYNDAYGIAADPTVVQQEGQDTVSIGGGSTYNEVPVNRSLGDNLQPIYIAE